MPAPLSRRLVALALPPGEEFIAALEAAWARGDAVLPLDPHAPAAVTDTLLAAMDLDAPVDDDVALVIATSGSTGAPKGAQLTHAALAASARATHARIGRQPGDHWLSCLPWQHIGGIQVMLRSRLLDIPLTIHDRFTVDRVAAAADATLTSLVPTQLMRLLDAGVDLSRFRAILLGGAAAAPSLLARARAAGAPIVTTYGMSETAGGCVYDGRPLDGVDVRLDDDGRVLIRGPVVMSGYRRQPTLTAEALVDGWLRTSDLGEIDSDGVRVVGRIDDVVITGGENVVTSQVAAVLSDHPDIAEVAVTGVADPEWGHRIVAVVVPRVVGQLPTLPELREWCGDRLSAAARPRGLVVVGELPKLGSGKADRQAISRLAAAAD